MRVLDAHRRQAVLRVDTPDEGPGVRLVREHAMDRGLEPSLAPRTSHTLAIECLGDVQRALALKRHVEDAPDDGLCGRTRFQSGPRSAAILDLNPRIPVGGIRSDPEATGRGLAHPAHDLLGQVLAVELIHTLDDRLHELAGWGVVGVLGDGDDADAAPAQHRLEGDGVLPLPGETRELPDKDLLEGRIVGTGSVQHLPELRAVGDAAALRLVDVLADHDVAVLLGVVAQRPQLRGDGEVDVLAVARDPRIEGGGGGFGSF
ncbi:MAG: hypothetical protein OXC71_01160 [Chloroflexi bacterium]|nr:hypothetical protein [Chloroflexota bacterium]